MTKTRNRANRKTVRRAKLWATTVPPTQSDSVSKREAGEKVLKNREAKPPSTLPAQTSVFKNEDVKV